MAQLRLRSVKVRVQPPGSVQRGHTISPAPVIQAEFDGAGNDDSIFGDLFVAAILRHSLDHTSHGEKIATQFSLHRAGDRVVVDFTVSGIRANAEPDSYYLDMSVSVVRSDFGAEVLRTVATNHFEIY